MSRTISNPATNSSVSSSVIRNELQLLEDEVANITTGHTHDGVDSHTVPIANTTGTLAVARGGTGVTSSTGTGSVVLSNSPTLVSPVLGAASATSINGTSIPSSKTLVVTTDKLSVLAATSSSELAGVISDETGSGSLVFGTSPTITNGTLVTPTIADFTNATHNHQSNAGGGQLNATSVFSAGTVPTARLGSGTANSGTFLRGDQTWVAGAPGTGTVTTVGSADGSITVTNPTTTPDLAVVLTPALKSATTTVNVSSATAPTSGQVLTATSGSAATWQTPSASGANTALSNLASVAINTSLLPGTDDGAALGSTTKEFSDLFLAEGGVINWDNGDATITQTGNDITVAGITTFGVGTSTAVTLGTIELGAASDTTIARVSAGIASIEGVTIDTASNTLSLTNKTISGSTNVLGGITMTLGSDADGDMYYRSGNVLTRLPKGTQNTLLRQGATNPGWSTETWATPGTSGNVLTSNGTNWTSAAPVSSSTPVMAVNVAYNASTRFTTNNTGDATATFGTSGGVLTTSATATSGTRVQAPVAGNANNTSTIALGNPTFSCGISLITIGTDVNTAHWMGAGSNTGGAITYTGSHIGFKIIRAASGSIDLFATQANGATETASSSLTTVAAADFLDLIAVVTSSTNVAYYWRKNGGSLSSATNLTTNIPTDASNNITHNITNVGVATNSVLEVNSSSYQR